MTPGSPILSRISRALPPLSYRSPWKRFLQYELVAAGALALASFAGLFAANVPALAPLFHAIREFPIIVSLGPLQIAMTFQEWTNNVLMCMFFFLIGLQIKYEVLVGRLRSPKAAALPIIAACGGMVFPILMYLAVIMFYNRPDAHASLAGWAIPMSTDIAFVAGCMSLLRRRVPRGLYIFMVTLAIVDDLGAVIVIGAMHFESLQLAWFVPGVGLIVAAWLLGRQGVQSALFFFALGGLVWVCFTLSGIHATVAGVLMAFAIPLRSKSLADTYLERMGKLLTLFRAADNPKEPLLVNEQEQVIVRSIARECFYVESALQRILYSLEPFCALLVLPLFAFLNSGLEIPWSGLAHNLAQPVTVGVFLGLLLGKQFGISLMSWCATAAGLARFPEGVRFRQIWALSWLGGIGFTMALFLSELAFASHAARQSPIRMDDPATAQVQAAELPGAAHLDRYNEEAKTGIFLASGLSGIVGLSLLLLLSPAQNERKEDDVPETD